MNGQNTQVIIRAMALFLTLMIAACGGNNDPVLNEINEELEIDIDYFDVSLYGIYPGDDVRLRWSADGAWFFGARVYISTDSGISTDDWILVDEQCGVEHRDHCASDREVKFYCGFYASNEFICREDGDELQYNDLTGYFPSLPFDGYLILELCGEENCDRKSRAVRFY